LSKTAAVQIVDSSTVGLNRLVLP